MFYIEIIDYLVYMSAVLHGSVAVSYTHLASSSGLTLGCLRSEKAVGTSGIAICLTLGTPYAVYGKEHFIQPHHDYICCGAPVYSQEREILGCLALIGPYRLAPAHSLGMITAAADGVEKELKLRLTYDKISEINSKFQFTLDSLSVSYTHLDVYKRQHIICARQWYTQR